MKNLLNKRGVLITCLVMLVMAIVGLACLEFMRGYDGLGVVIIMWLIPTVIGGFLFLLSGVFLLLSQIQV